MKKFLSVSLFVAAGISAVLVLAGFFELYHDHEFWTSAPCAVYLDNNFLDFDIRYKNFYACHDRNFAIYKDLLHRDWTFIGAFFLTALLTFIGGSRLRDNGAEEIN